MLVPVCRELSALKRKKGKLFIDTINNKQIIRLQIVLKYVAIRSIRIVYCFCGIKYIYGNEFLSIS